MKLAAVALVIIALSIMLSANAFAQESQIKIGDKCTAPDKYACFASESVGKYYLLGCFREFWIFGDTVWMFARNDALKYDSSQACKSACNVFGSNCLTSLQEDEVKERYMYGDYVAVSGKTCSPDMDDYKRCSLSEDKKGVSGTCGISITETLIKNYAREWNFGSMYGTKYSSIDECRQALLTNPKLAEPYVKVVDNGIDPITISGNPNIRYDLEIFSNGAFKCGKVDGSCILERSGVYNIKITYMQLGEILRTEYSCLAESPNLAGQAGFVGCSLTPVITEFSGTEFTSLPSQASFFTSSLDCINSRNFWCSSGIDEGYCSEYGNCNEGYDYDPKLAAQPLIQSSRIDKSTNTLFLAVRLESTHKINGVTMQVEDDTARGDCKNTGTKTVQCAFEKTFSVLPDTIQPVFIADVDEGGVGQN